MAKSPKSTRGREPRAVETMEERRARTMNIGEHKKRLATGGIVLDYANWNYRWVNDDGFKLEERINNDTYDFVSAEGKSVGTNKGTVVSVQTDIMKNGKPLISYLMRKPKTYFDEDQANKMAMLDEKMNQIRKGADGAGPGITGGSYNPTEGIRIK